MPASPHYRAEDPTLAKPEGLSALGEKAYAVIRQYLREHNLDYTGGCTAFYSPAQWAAREEAYGLKSELIVVYDGGNVRECFDSHQKYDHEEALTGKLKEVGLYAERCAGWYSAIYPI